MTTPPAPPTAEQIAAAVERLNSYIETSIHPLNAQAICTVLAALASTRAAAIREVIDTHFNPPKCIHVRDIRTLLEAELDTAGRAGTGEK